MIWKVHLELINLCVVYKTDVVIWMLQVMGWAYARGDHITKEHVIVYWLAPIEATLLAIWTFRLLFGPLKQEKEGKTKPE